MSNNDSSLERRRAATGSFNSRRSQQSMDNLSTNTLLTQSAVITGMFGQAQENRSLAKSTDTISSEALNNAPQTSQHHLAEEKNFIKISDLLYFLSDENIAIFGEGVGTLYGRKNDDSLKTDFLGAIFRVQPKYEYGAQTELLKYHASKSTDAEKLEKLEENVENEKKRNAEEERVLGGSVVYYGQIIQLVHFGTNMVLSGDKKQRSDLDPGSLKLELRKEGSKSSWFKIMPRYKVRFEGEEIRQFDKVCLIHVKSGMFVHLSDKTYEDNEYNEVHLNSTSTSWTVFHFMSFQPQSEQYIKAGDVVRIFHQEKEGFLKANLTPLFNDSQYDLFLKVKGKKGNAMETKSSNTLFLIELKQNIGGMIAWRTEVRLKHLGTGKYLAINYKSKDSSKLHLILTSDLKSYEEETLFVFNPVDPGTNFISFGTYCRIQGKKIGDKKLHWLHVGEFIESKTEDLGGKGEDDTTAVSFARNKFLEVQFTEKFHYEDAVLFKPVKSIEIEELNYVNSLYAVLIEFAKKLKGTNNLADSNGNSVPFQATIKKSRTNVGILPVDTDPVKETLKKLIAFVNKSDETDALKQDGIPLPGHQTLLFEQQMIEASIDILIHLFGFNSKSFGTPAEINADSKEQFARHIGKKENKHILELVTLVYKFLQMIVKENHKFGMFVSQWMNIFLTHMGTGVGVRKTLIELFKDNKTLLETIPTKTIDSFIQLLLEVGKDAKLLEFLVVICTCDDTPVLKNQMYILSCLHKNPQLLFATRPAKDGRTFEINVGVKEEVWIPFEEFVKAKVYKKKTVSDGTNADTKNDEDEKKDKYEYPYNTRYMKEVDYFKQLLQLYYRVCLANDKAVLFLSEGDKASKIPPLITSDMVFSCLRNDSLPGSLRSYFCDLLYLWIDKDLPASPNSGVKYTWSWDEIVNDYVVKRIGDDAEKDKNSWTSKNLTELQHFLFQFLQKNQDLPIGDKESRQLLLSVLVVLSKMVNYGFFLESKDQESLIPVLLQIVNGKTEVTPQSTKFSRFEMTESSWPVIKTKLQVCKILHSFYDVRLEKKTADNLFRYKSFYESGSKETRKKNIGLLGVSASSEEEKSDDPNEIALRSITYQPTYDEKIRSILLDTSLYQYEPLTTSALSLLLRHMRSRDELISTLDRVQLLTDEESVRLYHHISKQLGRLQQILEDNDISEDDSPHIIAILKDFIKKCCVEEDMNRPNPKSQTLFRNLNVHNEILRVLRLQYRDEYHYTFKLCYLFLKMFVQNNKTNQEILFPLLDFMLSQMGMQLNIADTLTSLVKENYNICSQLDTFFIGHMVKLLYVKGHKPRYVHLLDAIVSAEDKTLKENQTTVATQILAKREHILTNYYELKVKSFDGSFANLAAVAKSQSKQEGKQEESKDDIMKKRAKLARINTTLATMNEGLDFKIDLETYEVINATKVSKDEDELLYHVAVIDLLGKTSKDKNHATEALCQALFTVPDIIKIIRDPAAGPLVKGAYTRFLSEVWLFTERPLNLHLDEQVWDLMRFYREELRKFTSSRMSPMDNNYIFEGVLFIMRTFFSCEFPEVLSPERVATSNDILGAVVDMLGKFKNDSHKILSITNTILQITSSKIKGLNTTIGSDPIDSILEKAKKTMGTMGHKTLKNFKRELLEEKRKVAYLKIYIKKLSEEKVNAISKRTILEEEFDKSVRLFKDKLMKRKKKADTKEVNTGSNSFVKRKGAQYVQKLIMQLQSEEEDKKLILDCLSILTAMIELEDAPIEKMALKKLGKTPKELKDSDKDKLQDMWREKVQNRLGELGAMQGAIALINSTSASLIFNALNLCCNMLAGGNRNIQEKMMAFFLSTPDPHFFDHMRSRIAGAITELKNKRREANTVKRRNISSQGSVIDDNELEDILEMGGKREYEKDNVQKLLLFMQNLCEGHYTEMKDYLRDQWDNTKSFNLVKECVSLATELERGIEENFELGNQLFRTLNEFASGCPGNQVTITEAKVYVPFNRIMSRIPQCNNEDILELKNSMLDLMLSLVEGMFPEKETATSYVPEILMENVDFLSLETNMENGSVFSEIRSDFEVLQLNIQKRQKFMQQQLMKTVATLGDSGAPEEKRTSFELPVKERAESLEESLKAKEVVSKCLILMQILARYDEDKKTKAKAILKKVQWANYSQENIGNIELLNETGELEQVYFTIPPVCHNLQEATKEEFLKVVKRDSPTDKIDDFVRRSGTLQYEIYHHTKLAKSRVHFLSALYSPIRNLLLLITIIVNGLMIGLYDGETLQYSEYTRFIFYGLCGLHLLISTAWVGVYMWMWAPVIIFRRVQDRKEELREANLLLKKEGKKLHSTEIGLIRKLTFLFTDGLLVYHFLFWFFSVVSIPYFPVMAFHMIDLSVRSDGVINVVKAVTTNGRSLILTAVLLIILIYIYTVIGYFGLPGAYASNNCQNLYTCILYNINAGIRNGGGIGDVLNDVAPGDSTYIGRFFFDLTFFLIIIILGLNIVFGIILDTFGELRDKKSFIEEDMRSTCFICGIDSDTFQRQALGFKHHIKHDHNMWSYLYFFIYLDEKDQDEYTFIEEYVAEKRKTGENDYFPIAKAICLSSKKKKKGG